MNIRFPKKNIAQHQADRLKKAAIQEPKKEEIVKVPEFVPDPHYDIPFFQLGPAANSLYPVKLHRLHEDLEMLGRLRHLPPKERKELQRRLPGSLPQAEAKADKMLADFVQNAVKIQGIEVYSNRLKESVNDQVQIMLALRCYIAAKTVDAPRNKIVLYRNKAMNSWDFFPKSSRQTITDPKTGAESIFINYQADDKAPYKRQDEMTSKQHYEVGKVEDAGPKKIDRLPKQWGEAMDGVLQGFGHNIENVDEAWILLEKVSKNSTIEERILSKITYLITNATVHKKNKMLPG